MSANIIPSPAQKPKVSNFTNAAGVQYATDFNPAVAASQTLFPFQPYASFQERFIYNPNAAGSLWINIYGGVAVANGMDCIEIPPGTAWVGSITNEINVLMGSNTKITYGER